MVGNTPADPVGNDYNAELLLLLPIWYSVLSPAGAENPPIWLTYAQAVANNEYNDGWGPIFVKEWTDEYLAMAWPTYANAILDDPALNLGPYWFAAYWAQSTKLNYNNMLANQIGSIWNARLNATATAEPLGGAITTVGGYRYHTFLLNDGWSAFYTGTTSPRTVDVLYVAGGGAGGRYDTGNSGGGGGAGALVATAGYSAVDICEVTVGARGSAFIPAGDTIFDGNTVLGGGRGGHLSASTPDGAAGGSGGGGSGTTTPASGAGGGNTGGFNGGVGFGAATPSGGGGGGSSAAGVAGTASDGGGGGAGTTWLNGVTYAGGGGGARTSATGAGGSGGGGSGGAGASGGGAPATADRGSGGGGSRGTGIPGAGSAGIVIIRYPFP